MSYSTIPPAQTIQPSTAIVSYTKAPVTEETRATVITALWTIADYADAWNSIAGFVGNATDKLGYTIGDEYSFAKAANWDENQQNWLILAVLVLCAEGEIE